LAPTTAPDVVGSPGELLRLCREECLALLGSRSVGRFAHVESVRALDVVPVNYVSRDDGSVLFRTGPGPKLSAADRGDVVGFEVDDIDEATFTGWSVLVVGRARRLTATEVGAAGALPRPWALGPRHHVVVVEPTRIEGRRLT
jgi:nitroimidazol reductase NimA-like FMN-containing flavoprotein (pyridoxamine 5'-phosphate oxidase superfamily)